MTTTELNSAYIPNDPSSLCHCQPLELEKTCVALTPPNTHALPVEEGHRTSVVNNITLEDGALGESREDDRKDPSTGEHGADDSHPPPSPRERLERSPVTDGRDSARFDAPIDLSNPPTPIHHFSRKADQDLPAAIKNGDQEVATTVSQRPKHPTTPPPDRIDDMFSLSDLPTLQTFIPNDLFPDDLFVHDPDNITKLRRHKSQCPSDVPVRYVRIFPNLKAPREPFLPYYLELFPELKAARELSMPPEPAFLSRSPADPVRAGHLYLKADNSLGTGHHSSVFSAPLRLQLDPASGEESTVRVAAKTAHGSCGAHKMLHLEAGVYDAFPRHFMDDQYVAGTVATLTAASSDGTTQPAFGPRADAAADPSGCFSTSAGDKRTVVARWTEPAVVPKFYGYYAAVAPDGSVVAPMHLNCGPDATCAVSWPTRILLVEECGRPIFPQLFTQEQKLHCLQLVKRLHAAGFAQNSMHVRNILVQPGPLRAPPAARSYATPSFRIIDFGRGVVLSHLPPRFQWMFSMLCEGEEWRAVHRVLELCRAAGGSQCAQVEPFHMDTFLCWGYEGLISLHWSKQERRWWDFVV